MSQQKVFTPVVLFEEGQLDAPRKNLLGFLAQADGPELQLRVPVNLVVWFEREASFALLVSLIAEAERNALVLLPPALGSQVRDRMIWVPGRNLAFAYKCH
jgi:hypothetical protein